MAWSDEARRRSAEVRRAKAKTKGAAVSYYDREFGSFPTPNRGVGAWAFSVKGSKGAIHKLFIRGARPYGEAKKVAMGVARRVSAKTGRHFRVTKLS